MSESMTDARVLGLAEDLGEALAAHPLTLRLKRIEESIREDEAMLVLWRQLEGVERGGGCRSGSGCGSGGCGTAAHDESPPEAAPDKLSLMARFADAPLLQEYVQVKHRFYALVDAAFETAFQRAYGKAWMGEPEVDVAADPLLEAEPPAPEHPGPLGG